MRRPIVILAFACGCSPSATPALQPCVTRSDCAPSESCLAGRCTSDNSSVTHADAGPKVHPGGFGGKDAGAFDASRPLDSGPISAPDASTSTDDAGSADAGPVGPSCLLPITVEGGGQYCTIMDAVNAAPAGAIVDVPAGMYVENVTIPKALTVRAPDGPTGTPPTAIILSPSTSPPLTITGAGVTVQNFVLVPSGGRGVDITGQGTLQNVAIGNATGAAVLILGLATLDAVAIAKTNGVGVNIMTNASCTISNSVIAGSLSGGVDVDGAAVVIHSSAIINSGSTACSATNQDACAPGVFATNSAQVTIDEGTRIESTNYDGLQIGLGSSLMMSNATVDDNDGDGIYLYQAGAVQIQNSTVTGNFDYGIECDQSSAQCSGDSLENNSPASNCNSC